LRVNEYISYDNKREMLRNTTHNFKKARKKRQEVDIKIPTAE